MSKSKKITLSIIVLLILALGGYVLFGIIKKSQKPQSAKEAIEKQNYGINLLSLRVSTPSSTDTFWIQADKQMVYTIENEGEEIIPQAIILADSAMIEILEQLQTSDYFNLNEEVVGEVFEDQKVYLIRTLLSPGKDAKPEDAVEHQVSCIEDQCSKGVLAIKDAIVSIWGYPIGEIVEERIFPITE